MVTKLLFIEQTVRHEKSPPEISLQLSDSLVSRVPGLKTGTGNTSDSGENMDWIPFT